MGITGFYQWLVQRYPLIRRSFRDLSRPKFSNLYIDFNQLIYDSKVTCQDQDHLFNEVLRNLDMVVQFIRPTDLIFISIDGTPPMAKVQRNRKNLKPSYTGDSRRHDDHHSLGHIVAGSKMMDELHQELIDFLRRKTSSDSAWKDPQVIYSSFYNPGEAEHKIFEFIRTRSKMDDYFFGQTQCVYSNDADLIPLILLTGEHRFCLLRKVQHNDNSATIIDGNLYNGNFNMYRLTEDDFDLVYINILREYISAEFQTKDQNRLFADWVALLNLLGNDFVDMKLRKESFEIAMGVYKDIALISDEKEKWLVDVDRQELNIDVFADFCDHFGNELNCSGFEQPDEIDEKKSDVQKATSNVINVLNWILKYYIDKCPSWSFFNDDKLKIPSFSQISKYAKTYQKVDFKSIVDRPLTPFEYLLATYSPLRDVEVPQEIKDLAKTILIDYYPINSEKYSQIIPYNLLISTAETAIAQLNRIELLRNESTDEMISIENGSKSVVSLKMLPVPKKVEDAWIPSLKRILFSLNYNYKAKLNDLISNNKSKNESIIFEMVDNHANQITTPLEELNKIMVGKFVLVDYPFLKPIIVTKVKAYNRRKHKYIFEEMFNKNGIDLKIKNPFIIKGKTLQHISTDHSYVVEAKTEQYFPYCLSVPLERFPSVLDIHKFNESEITVDRKAIILRGEYKNRICAIKSIDKERKCASIELLTYNHPKIPKVNDDKNFITYRKFVNECLKNIKSSKFSGEECQNYLTSFSKTILKQRVPLAYTLFTSNQKYVLDGYVRIKESKNDVVEPLIANCDILKSCIKNYFNLISKLHSGDISAENIKNYLKNDMILSRFSLVKSTIHSFSQISVEKIENFLKGHMVEPMYTGEIIEVGLKDLLWEGKRFEEDQNFSLGDRVVSIASGGQVPFGAFGTLIGMDLKDDMVMVMTDNEMKYGCTMRKRLDTNRGVIAWKYDFMKINI